MRHSTASLVTSALLFTGCATMAFAQVTPDTTIKTPLAKPNIIVQAKPSSFVGPAFDFGPPFTGYIYQTPASLACIYGLVAVIAPGCNPNLFQPNSASTLPAGGSKAIAIVDAYDDPNAAGDLAFFSFQFGLPPANFHTVFARFGGSTPGSCTGFFAPTPPDAFINGWDIEESLDIEWAHSMAPHAAIYLVEAQSNSFADLLCAETTAAGIVAAYGSISPTLVGGGEVSNSWGAPEFFGEQTLDGALNNSNVVTFFSAGDVPGPEYPAVSPLVVSVGGTSLFYNPNFDFTSEGVWNELCCSGGATGGALSVYETRPAYQNGVSNILLVGHRGTPDVAAVGDPFTGVWVFDSLGPCCWYVVGGTSVATPVWAGISNNASTRNNTWATSSENYLTKLYTDPHAVQGTGPADVDFNDITYGTVYGGCFFNNPLTGYDLCSGLGSPKGFGGK